MNDSFVGGVLLKKSCHLCIERVLRRKNPVEGNFGAGRWMVTGVKGAWSAKCKHLSPCEKASERGVWFVTLCCWSVLCRFYGANLVQLLIYQVNEHHTHAPQRKVAVVACPANAAKNGSGVVQRWNLKVDKRGLGWR